MSRGNGRDVEAELARRKQKTALHDTVPVIDALMLHFCMDTFYGAMMKEHSMRADWPQTLVLSAKKYVGKLPDLQAKFIATKAASNANEVFGPVVKSLNGIDIRHVVIAFSQVVLTLVDQHRYRFTDDALVLQSLGIVSEAVDERATDWEYDRGRVRYLYRGFMKRVDKSQFFREEAQHEGVVAEVLL